MRSRAVNSFQNAETNWRPLSEMIVSGSPWSFHTWSRNSRATAGADISGQAIRCLILDSQSTTTIIFSQPLLLGSPITKSIEISFHLRFGTGSGFRRPLYVSCEALARRQVWQLATYLRVVLCIFSQ